ncbi:MAG TPA: hypothetical protein VKD89_11925 [Candidatus Udaeobacter sp.]|nr:hypothetical protein [Candidatus Udaeobacter sp.]
MSNAVYDFDHYPKYDEATSLGPTAPNSPEKTPNAKRQKVQH